MTTPQVIGAELRAQTSSQRHYACLPSPAGGPLALATARDVLCPPRNSIPRRREGLRAILDNRVSWVGIRHWLRGRRRPPLWAIALLREAIAARLAELQHADSLLESEQKKRASD